jgi:hypothetical protein
MGYGPTDRYDVRVGIEIGRRTKARRGYTRAIGLDNGQRLSTIDGQPDLCTSYWRAAWRSHLQPSGDILLGRDG